MRILCEICNLFDIEQTFPNLDEILKTSVMIMFKEERVFGLQMS